jgi:hypothetical protein
VGLGCGLSFSRPGQAAPLRRSRNRPLAALAADGPEIFPVPRVLLGPAAPALSFLITRSETSWPGPTGRCAGPFLRSAAT